MNEAQIDSFIAEIAAEMETIRAYQNDPVELTEGQKKAVKKLPKSEREEAKKRFLKELEDQKRERLSLLLTALEEKIKSSGLPAETKKELQEVMDQAKNTNYKFSPDTLNKVEEIKEKENAPKEKEVKDNDELATVTIAFGTAAVAATVVNKVAAKKAPKKRFEIQAPKQPIMPIAGMFTFNDEEKEKHPVYVEKVNAVADRSIKKIDPKAQPKSLREIEKSPALTPIEKKYAKVAFLEAHPEVKKDFIKEEIALRKTAFDKSVARHEAKHDPQKRKERRNQGKRPDYNAKEALVMKCVNRIKQKAGTTLSMEEIKNELKHPALIRIYEERMHKDHPEYFENRDKEAARKEKIAQLRLQRKLYRHQMKQEGHQKSALEAMHEVVEKNNQVDKAMATYDPAELKKAVQRALKHSLQKHAKKEKHNAAKNKVIELSNTRTKQIA